MVDGDEWAGIIKVHQVLQKTDCLTAGHYTVLKLERLLTVNQLIDFSKLMQSTITPHLLLMACEANQLLNDEAQDVIRELFNTIKHRPNIKIFLSTRLEATTLSSLQQICGKIFGKAFVARDERLSLSDITTESQEKLLEKTVNFQGINVALNELISAESHLAKLLPLGAIMEEKLLQIGKPVPISNTYNEDYYIGRTLRHHCCFRQDILMSKEEFPDLIASTEQEFEQLCQNNPERNVHLLGTDLSDNIVWYKSQGSLETLRRCVDTDSSPTYTAGDLFMLLVQAEIQRVMLISDTAGMGKSTLLTHLSNQIKQYFPAKWVVRIDLNDHTDALRALQQEQIDKETAIDFVSKKLLKFKPGLEMELFRQCCEQRQKVRIVIMLDGFDEISPFYTETVVDLLQALRQTAVEQLWVTTRPHMREELEDKLQQFSYTLEPFSEENKFEFLKKFWGLKGWFTELDNGEEKQVKTKLETCAEELINISKLVSDKDVEFTGIPLQIRILAEAFVEEIRQRFQSVESVPSTHINPDLLGLYESFIDRKYDVYLEEKMEITTNKVTAKTQKEFLLKFVREDHQLLALEMLLTEKQVTLLQIKNQYTFSFEELTRIGIVQINFEGKLQFIHITIAVYYVADYLVNRLTERNNISEQVETFVLRDIFQKEEYQVIRAFMDRLLLRSKPSKDIMKQYGNRIDELCQDGLTLHTAADEGNAAIIEFILDSLQEAEHTDTINKLLIAEDKERHTAWHLAARRCNTEVLEILWNCSKNKLTREDLKGKLLLAMDCEGQTAWHLAAEGGNTEALQKIWKSAKETLTTEELGNNFLLAQNREKETAGHVAAKMGNIEVLEHMWELAREELKSEELNNKLLLGEDISGFDASLQGTEMRYTELIQKLEEIRNWAKEKLVSQNSNVKLLLAKDEMKDTVWHVAAKKGKIELLQKIWDWAEEELTPEELSKKFLLAKDLRGKTAWFYAAEVGNIEMLEKLWTWAEGEHMSKGLTNKLLLATDNREQTAFHVAAEQGKTEVLQKLWEWATEKLTTEEIKNKLLLAKPFSGQTAWHYAAELGNTEVLEKLWKWAKEKLQTEDLHNKFLLAKNDYEQNILHVVAKRGDTDLLKKLWEWSEELAPNDLENEFFLAKEKCERTAWHLAAELGNTEMLEKLWDWAKQRLDQLELKNSLFLAKDDRGKTALHLAKERDDTEIFQKLWEWAETVFSTEELNQFVLDEDNTNWNATEEDENNANSELSVKNTTNSELSVKNTANSELSVKNVKAPRMDEGLNVD
jgi:ankyrin repeat protein